MHRTIGLLALVLVAAAAVCGSASGDPGASTTQFSYPTPTTFNTSDNTGIQANLYGQGATALIMSNMNDNDASDWDPTPTLLARQGYAVLTFTYRQSSDVAQYVDDLLGAITYMKHHGARKIVLVGASLGGLVAAKAAISQPVNALIILSSPTTYGDLSLSADQANTLTIPKLVVYATGDINAMTTPAFYQMLGDPKSVKTYPGSDHGAFLFDVHPDLITTLVQFLKSDGAGA
ncbi:MAG TPA: alpha/beta fold hydrolase [Ktedonobacterales bacterium]|nr:alpha/beta fold hydrolase [Ktedonobacterales bacterium]